MKPALLPYCLSALILAPAVSHGLGFRLSDQNPQATARGEAFVATADNPSAIYYNPAGITQLDGTQVLLGVYGISVKETVHLDAPGKNSSFSSTNTEAQFAPQFFLTHQPKNLPVTFGLGVYAPFGFSLDYPDDTPIRTLAKSGSLKYLTFNPVIAWKVVPKVSMALGLMVNYSEAKLSRGVIAPGDDFEFKGDGYSAGFNFGLKWDPHRMHHFGLTYRSSTLVGYKGDSRLHTNPFNVPTPFGPFTVPGIDRRESASADIRFPQVIVFGYSFQPTEDWNFEFNIDWTDWDSLKTVTLRQPSGNIVLPFNWQSSFFYEFGVTKKFAYGLRLSAGYIYSENSVPDASFNPTIPDSNRHVFSVGIGQTLAKFNWDLAYQRACGQTVNIDLGTVADGKYKAEANALTLSFGYKF